MKFVKVKKKIKDLTLDEMKSICYNKSKHFCYGCPLKIKGGTFCFLIKKQARKEIESHPLAQKEITFYKNMEELENDN